MKLRTAPRAAVVHVGRAVDRAEDFVSTEIDLVRTRGGQADLALFHEFVAPPYGGGNQFLLALRSELERRGLGVEINRLSTGTPACLFNSFNFDFRRLRRFARRGARMVHRVDGPIGVYRGFDDGTDARIAAVNLELADATVVQSQWSLERHRELGLSLAAPVVITNTVDPAIFHPPAEREPLDGRRVRLIASSWSDNPRKGSDTLTWLDGALDWTRYEMTFVGRAPISFEHIRAVGALPSRDVAGLLRSHDLYIAPSRDDPCSNALLEALACGLPAAYLASGGHPEVVGAGGLPFAEDADLPAVIHALLAEIQAFRGRIQVQPIAVVADRYLEALGL